MKTAILLMMTFAATAAFADPAQNTYTYRVKVPADSNLTCADHASAVAQLFATETGTQAVSGACDSASTFTEGGEQFHQEVLIITYTNDVQVTPYQAVLGGDSFEGQSDASSGLFATYADCFAEMGRLEPQFSSETGFAPVDAHCDPADLASSGYSLTIEGFGRPTNALWSYSEDATLEGDTFAADVIGAASRALQIAGASIAYSDPTHVFYYAPYDPVVSEEFIGTFSVKDECTSQQTQAQTIFNNAGLTGALALCEPFGSATSTDTSLVVVGAGMTNINDDDYDQAAYDSFAECTADLPRLLANAGSGGATNVYGALCAPSEDSSTQFQAHVYLDY